MNVNRTSMSQMPLEAYAGKPTSQVLSSPAPWFRLSDFMDICKWNIALNQEVALTTKQDAAFPTSNRRSQIAVFMHLKNAEEKG